MLVAVAGTKGSPGVTTVAFGLARVLRTRGPALLMEADPQGGSLSARLGIPQEPGLGTLAAAGRHELSGATVASHTQGSAAGLALLVAPSAPSHARTALSAVAEGLSQSVEGLMNTTVVVDLGRLDSGSPSLPLAAAAPQIIFLTQPSLEGTDALAVRLLDLADLRSRVQLVTMGEGAYGGSDLAQVLSVPHVGHIPHDPRGAGALWSVIDSVHVPRRPLLRALQSLANRLDPDNEGAPGPPARQADDAAQQIERAVAYRNPPVALRNGAMT
jgi:MinD-like ATPase involved in chromosome partitioning or flagellar assembly